jgi:osmoprotectant transport system ATP-binding protein
VPAGDVGVADVSELVNGWRLVTDPDRRPVGWANGDGAPPIPVAGVGPHGTARSLLDAAVSAPSGYAVRVDDDGRVLGVVSYGAIGRLLADKLKAASA